MNFNNKQLNLLLSNFVIYFILLSCGYDNSPEGVAENFLFQYFIELNQRGALEISTGLAEQKLQNEIALLQKIRMQPNLDLSKHKPFIDYKRVNMQKRQDSSITFYYEVTIEKKDGNEYRREMVLSLVEIKGKWLVKNFDTFIKDVP